MVGLVLSRIKSGCKSTNIEQYIKGEMFHGYAEICQMRNCYDKTRIRVLCSPGFFSYLFTIFLPLLIYIPVFVGLITRRPCRSCMELSMAIFEFSTV